MINGRDSKATYGPISQNYIQLEYIPCCMRKSCPVPGLENFKDLIFVSLISSVTLATPIKFHKTSRQKMNHLEVFHKSQIILVSLRVNLNCIYDISLNFQKFLNKKMEM